MYLSYPVTLADDGFGTVYAICPDIPEAMTYATNREEAAGKVRGALEGALELYRQQGRAIPRPTKCKADFTVDVQVEEAHVAPAPRPRRFAGTAIPLSRWAAAARF
ncbi:type II toxin-antitoxin system HicB family antitoxin [Sphingomonas parva]|uniref:Type II toxin-antitoxin system HicB family antitoxin n=1 Tax=Sphingomonas parva TaxID=2555898 RepID=A0A4Y8ZV80_9SPHN|nr:type II toxin-antitoxin system HicB family antitoxin [Sphingomonas parva]TFI59824.1 type II toxin-antitoxin system HicB family antitoxin [Sphingomonas parva]